MPENLGELRDKVVQNAISEEGVGSSQTWKVLRQNVEDAELKVGQREPRICLGDEFFGQIDCKYVGI